jgi:hypothetical protein
VAFDVPLWDNSRSPKGIPDSFKDLCFLKMMMLHQIRHGRQDKHATNHARCTKPRKAGQSGRHIEAKQSETIYLKRVEYNACQAKHWKSTPSMLMGEAQPLGPGTREPGCEQTRQDDQGRLHPSPLLGIAEHAGQNHARQTRKRWKLWKWPAVQQTPA